MFQVLMSGLEPQFNSCTI